MGTASVTNAMRRQSARCYGRSADSSLLTLALLVRSAEKGFGADSSRSANGLPI